MKKNSIYSRHFPGFIIERNGSDSFRLGWASPSENGDEEWKMMVFGHHFSGGSLMGSLMGYLIWGCCSRKLFRCVVGWSVKDRWAKKKCNSITEIKHMQSRAGGQEHGIKFTGLFCVVNNNIICWTVLKTLRNFQQKRNIHSS